jgi:hypothetical protein
MVVKERPPGLRRLETAFRHEAGHGTLGHIDTDLGEFAMVIIALRLSQDQRRINPCRRPGFWRTDRVAA